MLIALRKALRRWVPLPLRRSAARLRRGLADRRDGTVKRLARHLAQPWDSKNVITMTQEIKQSLFWEGKLANLQRGAAMLDGVKIAPGQVFSFWHWIGQPTTARGFANGRVIRDDEASADPGGGLCQLSGITYELALRTGLNVIERHAHSRDLYQSEGDRFTQLGLDATVVWPWKDLRFDNPLDTAVVLRFAVDGLVLKAWLQAEQGLAAMPITLERRDFADHRQVTVLRAGQRVSSDRYSI